MVQPRHAMLTVQPSKEIPTHAAMWVGELETILLNETS